MSLNRHLQGEPIFFEVPYRLFGQENLAELTIIRALRAMDVSIPELGRILEVRRSGRCNCSMLKNSITTKMASIEQRIS